MVAPTKKLKKLNGYELDGEVLVKTTPAAASYRIRHLGEAGFYVRGLITCFYWSEKGRTWDDVAKVGGTCQ